MSEEKPTTFEKFSRLLARFSLLLTFCGFAFLFFVLLTFINRLEALAPAELRLFLEIVKNRFFR